MPICLNKWQNWKLKRMIKGLLKSLFVLLFSTLVFSDTKLVILGSGTPNPDPERSGSAYAVLINGKAYLVDFGPGIVRRASSLSPEWGGEYPELSIKNLKHAFLTHIHSDHSAGLSDLILTPWVLGRDEPLRIYGPKGTKDMVYHVTEAYKLDINYRINGSQPSNQEGYKSEVTEITEGVIFKNSDLIVESIKINHGSLVNSFGYKFTTKDKVIVFSGDTAESDNLFKKAEQADILVHEVYSESGWKKKTQDWQKYHKAHHTSAVDLGFLAEKANVKKLVLSHLLLWGSSEESLIKEVQQGYSGEVVIAKDLMVLN